MKKAKPERRGTAFWIERDGGQGREVWLVERPGTGMLGGMRALPDDGWTARRDGSGEPPFAAGWENLGAVRHVFTHAALTLEVRGASGCEAHDGNGRWWPIDSIEDAGLPTLFAKAARLALARDERTVD